LLDYALGGVPTVAVASALRRAPRGAGAGTSAEGAGDHHVEASVDVGDVFTCAHLSAANVGAETGSHLDTVVRLGAGAAKADCDRSRIATRGDSADHRAGPRAAERGDLGDGVSGR